MITYTPKYFKVEELVPKSVFLDLGPRSLILMDCRMLYTIDLIRQHFNSPITINNWNTGGSFSQRGLRTDDNTGAKYSQHRYGRAIDFDVKGKTAEQVRAEIIKNKDKFEHITVLETDVSWVHMDCRNQDRQGGNITLVKP